MTIKAAALKDARKCLILVDNSNVFIGGQIASAMRLGLSGQDHQWRTKFGALLNFLLEGRPLLKAILVGSRPPRNDSLWKRPELAGFEVVTHDRNSANREKAVDTELATRGARHIAVNPPGVLIIASGDGDLLPLVRLAKELKWKSEVAAFSGAFSSELMAEVGRKRILDGALDLVGHRVPSSQRS
jgi:hypothetical protein